jgi:ubiquinone/menaquinone biosynthesis C-methylase UbiE
MDIFTALNPGAQYSTAELQFIVGAWVMSTPFEQRAKVSTTNGDIAESDYDKRSIYSLLYSLYRSMGEVESETGRRYQFTFNTWGYSWPEAWGEAPVPDTDPERFGRNAYTGLFHFSAAKKYVNALAGRVHVIEMGCGTGAGAHQICKNVLPGCTYQAFDMQQAAIETCKQKFVPELGGRLVATRADCTDLPVADGVADFATVCETHVNEVDGVVTEEDKKFFNTARRVLKPGGLFLWGNAIPTNTWQPSFAYLEAIGMKRVEICDVTTEAIKAREVDKPRADAYVEACLKKFWGFRIPRYGARKRAEARAVMLNFYRNPGTSLYLNMTNGTDSYKVVAFQKAA